ncbi:hypothetical protein EDF46_1663 [Frondihabitans sp. PhB188]|uniref:glycyl-tRNA synthetase n=1 Tax=Frondihabitans sp. PhB188 TaxID=2485200 RepID=UPI000F47CD7F|nr:glycyl-tRNA synthetase [Frondihabitans sp. PhB188]ROQ40027.1 hypothetical protein EDF46_1663 [Frondihabitans sp. PhB188]
MIISELVAQRGGILHKNHLVALGATDRDLTWAVRHGHVRRARRGWYTTFAKSDPRFVAVQVGGRLTGASALRIRGAWMWGEPPVTVSVPANASRLRRRKGVRVVWDSPEVGGRGDLMSVGLRDALRQAVLDLAFEEAVAVLDWALSERHLDVDEVPQLLEALPQDVRSIADWVDPKCGSFPESIARTRLRKLGHTVETQVAVDGNKAIDLVVDGVVGIEVDGREFHESRFEKDRRKDLAIVIEGRTPVRFSYRMLVEVWDRVALAVRTAVAAHRRGRGAVGNSGAVPRPARRAPRLWRLPAPRRRTAPELPTRGLARRPFPRIATIVG